MMKLCVLACVAVVVAAAAVVGRDCTSCRLSSIELDNRVHGSTALGTDGCKYFSPNCSGPGQRYYANGMPWKDYQMPPLRCGQGQWQVFKD